MLRLEHVNIRAGSFAIEDFNLEVEGGEYFVLMGPTGSGKSLILKSICGLLKVVGGRVMVDGVDVTHLGPRFRNVGYVPQNSDLFPHLTVEGNLTFPLKIRGVDVKEARREVRNTAERLGVTTLLRRSTWHLSGGEKQKVALGRALLAKPKIMVFDEPVSALDENSRADICQLLKAVQSERKLTTVHVCHNRDEAELLAHRTMRMNEKKEK